jgi:hypothetical protein
MYDGDVTSQHRITVITPTQVYVEENKALCDLLSDQ